MRWFNKSGHKNKLNLCSYGKAKIADRDSRGNTVAGFKIAAFQIRKIKKFFDSGVLNKGKQK